MIFTEFHPGYRVRVHPLHMTLVGLAQSLKLTQLQVIGDSQSGMDTKPSLTAVSQFCTRDIMRSKAFNMQTYFPSSQLFQWPGGVWGLQYTLRRRGPFAPQ